FPPRADSSVTYVFVEAIPKESAQHHTTIFIIRGAGRWAGMGDCPEDGFVVASGPPPRGPLL
ncbi:MAG: hypothetical protein RDU41_07340, partial [Clostridia bacterium]|nr:hypothetical protein [Clostridia bacterium]